MNPRLKADSLNRRCRFAGQQPTGKRIVLADRDFAYFAALERHGPLPTTYLYEFTKHMARNFKGHQQRLTDLYNEDNTPHRGFYLERPEQQYASINARYQPLTYELTELGRRALRDRGIPRQMWEAPNGPYLHRFMTACITASMELAVQAIGFRYLSQADIFGHEKCPPALSQADNPLALPCADSIIVPDALFGIDYGGKYRFFALEADRKTETVVSAKAQTKSYSKKLEAYMQVFEMQSHRQVWGIPTLTLMTVTTSQAHQRTMITKLDQIADGRMASRFLFKSKPQFGKYWTVPEVMYDLLIDPWMRVGVPIDIGMP